MIAMEIKVLGTGCSKCITLEKAVKDTLKELNIEAQVIKVDDIVDIMNYGVLRTPGLVIDEKIVMSGRLPSAAELKEILIKNR